MDYKQKKFCDSFLKTFDLAQSCAIAKVNKNKMLVHLYDKDSAVSKYIQEHTDVYALSNSFITTDFIKYKLGLVVLNGDNQHIIAASKILLGYEDDVDKTSEFVNLIKALKGV